MQEQFGRYVLLERVAVGGMAEIFRAKAPGLGGFEKILAIKRLHPRYSQDEDFIDMLIDEARITVELSHTNIGQIFDLGQVEDHYFIAMEFIDGRDVYRLMRKLREQRDRMPIEAAAYIAAESCAGLDFAHRKKDNQGQPLHIVHRDVSPQNILVSFEGEVKIVDFGIAKATHRAYQTGAGIIKGKVYCMSPEQARGEVLDHRTDIFSLGIVLYEMVTGELVYRDDDDVTLLSQVRKADIRPPSTLRPEIPSRLEQIIMRSLARERGDRYPSAQHMQRDLQRFLASYDANFGRIKLSKYMRSVFDADAQSDLSAEREAVKVAAEPLVDAEALVSIASFDENDDRTVTEGDLSDASDSVDELPSDLFEIVESGHMAPDVSESALSPSLQEPSADEFFEEEPTRTFDRGTNQYESEPSPSEIRRAKPVQQPAVDPEPPRMNEAYRGRQERAAVGLGRSSNERRNPSMDVVRQGAAPADFQSQPTAVFDEDIHEQGPQVAARPVPFRAPARAEPDPPRAPASLVWLSRLAEIDRKWLYLAAVMSVIFVLFLGLTTILVNRGEPEPFEKSAPTVEVRAAKMVDKREASTGAPTVVAPSSTDRLPQATNRAPSRQRSANQPGASPALPSRGTVHIVSQPNGARVRIDGAWVPEMTPTRQVVSSGRPVQIHIRHQKYQAYDQDVRVRPGEEVAINAVLQPLYGTIQIESIPSNALIIANSQERGRTPSTLSRLLLDQPVRIKLMKDGWKSHEEVINWDDGTERRHRDVTVKLESLQRDPPPTVTRRANRRARRSRKRTPIRRPPPPRPAGRGRLSVVSRPWGAIYVNDRMVHPEGPLIGHELRAGTHRVYVCFRGNQQDCTSPRRVTIRANQNAKETFQR
ncbi:MAG: serine/threonine-protein kinase [Myxococcota bacterium]|nr:serine/threonine-protein kinase [Myxococcota bacterium]